MKQCTACDEEKPLSDFSFIKAKGIYEARCRRCRYWLERRDYNVKQQWNALDDAELLTLDAIGIPLDVIAVLIERSVSEAEAHLTLLREKLFKEPKRAQSDWTQERIARLRKLINVKGYSRSQAAEALGVSKNAVISATQRYLPQLCGKRVANALIQRRA